MSWALIDDNVPTHPKFIKAGPAACWLWLCGVVYARKHHTNGVIPRQAIAMIGVQSPRRLIDRLVEVRLWDETPEGWMVHDYQQHYGDDLEAKAEKDAQRERKRLAGRSGGISSGVTRRNRAEAREAETPVLLQAEQQAEAKQSREALSVPYHSVPEKNEKNVSSEPSNGSKPVPVLPSDSSIRRQPATKDASPVFLAFPVTGPGGPEWALHESQIAEWVQLFPGADIRAWCREALAWVLADRSRRKTCTGMPRFLVGWFTRNVNSGRARSGAPVAVTKTTSALEERKMRILLTGSA